MSIVKVRLIAELALGDIVRTPAGHEARVTGFYVDRVSLEYLSRHLGDVHQRQVALKPEWLRFLRKGAPHVVPPSFFKDEVRSAPRG